MRCLLRFQRIMTGCPYVFFAFNVADKVRLSSESKSDGEEKKRARMNRESSK